MQAPPPPPGQPPQAPVGPPRGGFDTSSLPVPDIVVAGGALLAFIFSLLNWYKVEFGFGFGGASGRGSYQNWPMIIYLLLLLFAGFFIVNALVNFVSLDIPLGPIYIIWAIAGLFFTLLAFVIRPGDWDYVKINWAMWIVMIVLSILPIVGGWMKVQKG